VEAGGWGEGAGSDVSARSRVGSSGTGQDVKGGGGFSGEKEGVGTFAGSTSHDTIGVSSSSSPPLREEATSGW
jgi:hypothetical protein